MSPWFLLLLRAALAADPAVVTVPAGVLLPAPRAVPEAPPVGFVVDALRVEVTPGDEARVVLEADLRILEPGWVDLGLGSADLALDAATLDGEPVALPPGSGGIRRFTAHLSGNHRLRVSGTLLAPAQRLALPLPQAARVRVTVRGSWDATVEGAVRRGGAFHLPAGTSLAMTWREPGPPSPRPRVVSVESATALSVDEAGLEGRAVLRYRVDHGAVDAVAFRLPGGVDDLLVEGPAVRSHRRQGDRVEVTLAGPLEGAFELRAAFRAPPPAGDRSGRAPVPVPEGVHQHEGWVSLSREDTAFVVPEPGRNLEPVARRTVPEWGAALVPGTPLAAWRFSGREPTLALKLLRYVPLEGPATLVDEARYEMTLVDHGRIAFRARYQVRNDRRQYLRMVVPEGWTLFGVRVAGRVVQPVSGGDGVILVPLEKSLESLQGLVGFPVEVTFLGREDAWERKGTRTIRTPSVDAEVAQARWDLWLPEGVEPLAVEGAVDPVTETPAASLAYGRATTPETTTMDAGLLAVRRPGRRATRDDADDGFGWSAGESARAQEEASVEVFNQAYRAYQSNRFDEAEVYLEEALEYDPSNASAQALLGNVQLLTGEGEAAAGSDEVQARRVRELAQARTVDTRLAQADAAKKAEEAMRAGDLEAAEEALSVLTEVTRELERVEQREDQEQRFVREEAEKSLAETRTKRKAREGKVGAGSMVAPEPEVAAAPEDHGEGVLSGADRWSDEIQLGDLLDAPPDAQPATDVTVVSGALGSRGSGLGGGGTAEGLGGLGTRGRGAGRGGAATPARPVAVPPTPAAAPAPVASATVAFEPPPQAAPAVTAAQLTLDVPRAGEPLAFQRQLLPPGEPLTLEIRYRTRRCP